MPKNYPKVGSQRTRAPAPDTHSPGGGDYTWSKGTQGAAGGGSYSSKRGSQRAAGGGDYTWSKGTGSEAGGGAYEWRKDRSGGAATGDVNMPAAADRGGGKRPPQRSRRGKGSVYGPTTASEGGV